MTAAHPAAPDQPAQVAVSGSQGVQVGDHNQQTNVLLPADAVPAPQRVPERPGEGPTVHNLPPVSSVLVGRDLDQLGALLGDADAGVVVGQAAVHGLGGIGKTELVAQYARRRLERYRLAWWVTADTPENITLGLAELTDRLHPMPTLAEARGWAIGWLQANTGWLLILDNVEDVDDIRSLLGAVTGGGRVVVTTRRDLGIARWRQLGLHPLPLEVLDRGASITLLMELTGRGEDAPGAGRLAEELGDLPLGLEQAAAYLSHHPTLTFDAYRARLRKRFPQLAADPGPGGNAERTIARVMQVSIDAVTAQTQLAQPVLAVLAWLAPDNLPADVLDPLADDPADPDDVDDALAVLASYSLVTRIGDMIRVHRLVQAVVLTTTGPVDSVGGPQARNWAAELLAAAVPEDPINNVAGWPRWKALVPHVDALLSRLPADHETPKSVYLADRAAFFRLFQGQVVPSIALFELALNDSRRAYGDDDANTLTCVLNLAYAYRLAGRAGEAITLYEQVHADARRALGNDHLITMVSVNSLATGYQEVGRIDEAIALDEQLLADRRRLLGEDHPHTVTSVNNLAHAYQLAGRVGEAITLFEHALADRRRLFGDDHPDTLTSVNNLASAYQVAGRVGDSIALYEQALAGRRRVLGEDFPATLVSVNNLAGAFQVAGRVDEAIALYEQVRTSQRRVLGDDHPDVLTTVINLAGAYQAAGRVGDAIALYERAGADARRLLGDDHPVTLTSVNNLAVAYQAAGRVGDAIARYEQALSDRRRVLGHDHPDTLQSVNNLASAYKVAGRLGDAAMLSEQALTDRRRVLGDDHPDTLQSVDSVAYAYQLVGRTGEAVVLFEQALTDRRRVLGEAHPDTLTSANNLAGAYRKAGRVGEAITLYEQALTIARRVLGDEHSITSIIDANLRGAIESGSE